jgi:hypothetical protein
MHHNNGGEKTIGNNDIWIMLAVIAIAITTVSALAIVVQAQTTHTNKSFHRYLCADISSRLDTLVDRYNATVGYDISNCPNWTVIIRNWDLITQSDKTTIINRMATAGYTEGEEIAQ